MAIEPCLKSYIDRNRVGAHLAVGSPPGTVRAPLDAYGSTSETAEGHILQRGGCVVDSVLGLQVGVGPFERQTEIAPIVVAAGLSRDNVQGDDFGRVFQR